MKEEGRFQFSSPKSCDFWQILKLDPMVINIENIGVVKDDMMVCIHYFPTYWLLNNIQDIIYYYPCLYDYQMKRLLDNVIVIYWKHCDLCSKISLVLNLIMHISTFSDMVKLPYVWGFKVSTVGQNDTTPGTGWVDTWDWADTDKGCIQRIWWPMILAQTIP